MSLDVISSQRTKGDTGSPGNQARLFHPAGQPQVAVAVDERGPEPVGSQASDGGRSEAGRSLRSSYYSGSPNERRELEEFFLLL